MRKYTLADLYKRVSDMENRVLMIFIRIAKQDADSKRKSVVPKLAARILSIIALLEFESIDQQFQLDRWQTMTDRAVDEDRKLVHAIATERRDEFAALLNRTKQCIDVLEVTASRITKHKPRDKSEPSDQSESA